MKRGWKKSLPLQTINGNAVETVNARELHAFLGSKQAFSDWIKNRVEQYDFVENQDFVKLHKKMELSKTGQMGKIEYFVRFHKKWKREIGGTTRIEYFVSVGMTKELRG